VSISIPDSWKVAMRTSGARPSLLVQIDTDGSTSFHFVSQWGASLGYPVSVSGMTPLQAKMDPRTRKPQAGGFTIDFKDDGALRRLNRDYRLKGKRVIVKLGYEGLASGSYQALVRGRIDDVLPSSDHTRLELKCTDAFSLLRDSLVTGEWKSRHPLDVINDILTAIALPTDLIDTTTLDRSASANSSFAHYLVNRTVFLEDDRRVVNPESGLKLVEELCALLNGSLVPLEDGKIAFKRYDYTAAAVAAWDTSVIRNLRVREVHGNIVNKFSMLMGWVNAGDANAAAYNGGGRNATENTPDGADYRYQFDLADVDSLAAYAYPGMSDGIYKDGASTKWVGMETALKATMTDATTSMQCHALALPGFCGSLGQGGGGYTAYTLSSGNPGYFRVGNEVVKATAVSFATDSETIGPDVDEDGQVVGDAEVEGTASAATGTHNPGPHGGHADVLTATYTVARAQFGTTAVAHTLAEHVVDITIGANLALALVGRFSNGCPIVEVDVPLSEHFVQLVDLVTLTHPAFAYYGMDGVTASTKWEVCGKQVTPLGSGAGITFTLAMAPTPPSFTKAFSWWDVLVNFDWTANAAPPQGWNRGIRNRAGELLRGETLAQGYVVSGCTVTSPSNLRIAISSGEVRGPGGILRKVAAMSRTYDVVASKDSYIYFDTSTGMYTNRWVNNGAGAPTAGPTEVFIAKVVSNGSAVTSISTTGKKTLPIRGDRLEAGSGPLTYLTQAGRHTIFDSFTDSLLYGDGSDGDATISGSTQLTADMDYENLTIQTSGNLDTNGWVVRVRGTLTIQGSGIVRCDGADGTAGTNASSATGAAGGAGGQGGGGGSGSKTLPTGYGGQTGGTGGNGHVTTPTAGGPAIWTTTTQISVLVNGAGNRLKGGDGGTGKTGAGTDGGAAGAAGEAIPNTANTGRCLRTELTDPLTVLNLLLSHGALPAGCAAALQAGAGGGGGGANTITAADGGGGGGGGGAGSGGAVLILARAVVCTGWTGRISANGGAGGNGGNGDSVSLPNGGGSGGGGGGGGGGSGGVVAVFCETCDDSANLAAQIEVSSGAAGSQGTGGTGGASAAAGTAGAYRVFVFGTS
jgi:hypothetical protein